MHLSTLLLDPSFLPPAPSRPRGRPPAVASPDERKTRVAAVRALARGAPVGRTADVFGVYPKTLWRWRQVAETYPEWQDPTLDIPADMIEEAT